MNRVENAHIRNPLPGSFERAASACVVLAPVGQGTRMVDGIPGYQGLMSGDAKRTGPAGRQGYTQHKFIGVEDNQ